MARFTTYQSPVMSPTDAAITGNLASAAAAFMGAGNAEDELNLRKGYESRANYERLLAERGKLDTESEKLAAEQALKAFELERRRGMLAAAQGKDQAALYAQIMGLGDAAVMGNYGDANLAAYAAGADPTGTGAPPSADVLRDPMLGRLTIGAGHPANTSNIGTVFLAGEQAKREANTAAQRRAAVQYAADRSKEASLARTQALGDALGKTTTTTTPAADITKAFNSDWENTMINLATPILAGEGNTIENSTMRAILDQAKYLQAKAAAEGRVLSDSAAMIQAKADVLAASGMKEFEVMDWNVTDPNSVGIPNIKVPTNPPVTPQPKVTTVAPVKKPAPSTVRGAPPPNPRAAELERAKTFIPAKGRDAVIRLLKSGGYTDAEIAAAGI